MVLFSPMTNRRTQERRALFVGAIIGPALRTRGERKRTWGHLRLRIEALELPVRYRARTPLLLSRGTRVPRR